MIDKCTDSTLTLYLNRIDKTTMLAPLSWRGLDFADTSKPGYLVTSVERALACFVDPLTERNAHMTLLRLTLCCI